MENFHDVGGQLSGSITKVDRELSWWEKRVDAIILYLVGKRIVLLDELRCATEELEPVEYERFRHYERNIIILEKLLVEKGFLSRTMLDRKFNERRAQERGFSASPRHQVHKTHTHEHASDHGTSEYEWRIDAIQEILVQDGLPCYSDLGRHLATFSYSLDSFEWALNQGSPVSVRAPFQAVRDANHLPYLGFQGSLESFL